MKKLFVILFITFCLQAKAQTSATITGYNVADSSSYCMGAAYMFETNPLVWYSFRWLTNPVSSLGSQGSTSMQPTITFTASGTYTINVVYGTNWGGSVAGASKVINVIDCALAIEQISLTKNQLNIYPSPAQNNFTIETTYADKQTLQLFDVNGKQVLTQSVQGKTTIDVSSLNAGIYNACITNNSGVTNKKVVIIK